MRKLVLAVVALLSLFPSLAQAQDFPGKPIKIVVPFPPGGSPDIIARILGEELQKKWKSPIHIENVAGAGGAIGAVNVAKSAPDGYTWLTAPNNVLIFNSVLGSANYDPVKDFTPVSMAISAPNIFVVANDFPAKSIAELIAFAKAQPGAVNFGTAGPGSPQDFASRLLISMTGIEVTLVPYRGVTPLLPDLMTNRVQVLVNPAAPLLPLVNDGKLRIIAGTGEKRYDMLPDTPTVAEAVPGYIVDIWTGIVLPAGVPAPIVAKINAGIGEVLKDPDVQRRIRLQGLQPVSSTPAAFAKTIEADLERWSKVVKATK